MHPLIEAVSIRPESGIIWTTSTACSGSSVLGLIPLGGETEDKPASSAEECDWCDVRAEAYFHICSATF